MKNSVCLFAEKNYNIPYRLQSEEVISCYSRRPDDVVDADERERNWRQCKYKYALKEVMV
jgi:hypothetical protein